MNCLKSIQSFVIIGIITSLLTACDSPKKEEKNSPQSNLKEKQALCNKIIEQSAQLLVTLYLIEPKLSGTSTVLGDHTAMFIKFGLNNGDSGTVNTIGNTLSINASVLKRTLLDNNSPLGIYQFANEVENECNYLSHDISSFINDRKNRIKAQVKELADKTKEASAKISLQVTEGVGKNKILNSDFDEINLTNKGKLYFIGLNKLVSETENASKILE